MADSEEHVIVIQADQLQAFCSTVYQTVGMSKADAEAVARVQVDTDLRGVHSHGTRGLPGYARQLKDGMLNPRPNITIVREGPGFALLDGDRGLGHLIGIRAMELAVQKARTAGIATVTGHNGGHFGAAGSFARMALDHGMIGMATECVDPIDRPNDSWRTGDMNPPLSYAIPAGNEFPVVMDTGCHFIRSEELQETVQKGITVPVPWPLTSGGQVAYDRSKERVPVPVGLLAKIKSHGLAMVMGTLSCLLTGGGTVPGDTPGHTIHGYFFLAIDVDQFTPLEQFTAEMDRMIQGVKSAPPLEGVGGVYLPGEIEWRKRAQWLRDGIPVYESHLRALEEFGTEVGVQPLWERR